MTAAMMPHPCAFAILAAIVDGCGDLSSLDLHERVPVGDVGAWYRSLQLLLDEGLAIRVEGPQGYLYRATEIGRWMVYAHIDVRGRFITGETS